jgi:hypothetical protein
VDKEEREEEGEKKKKNMDCECLISQKTAQRAAAVSAALEA